MAKDTDKKKVTYVAELILTSPNGTESVRSFDRAWRQAMELPTPVNIQFVKFVRKD